MALRMQGPWRSAEGKAVLNEDREDSMVLEGGAPRLGRYL